MPGNLTRAVLPPADADPQPRVIARPEVLLNRLQPVMPAGGAVWAQADTDITSSCLCQPFVTEPVKTAAMR